MVSLQGNIKYIGSSPARVDTQGDTEEKIHETLREVPKIFILPNVTVVRGFQLQSENKQTKNYFRTYNQTTDLGATVEFWKHKML